MSLMATRQILAMGGGGFSMEAGNASLDRELLRLSGKARPKVCFVPTASGDSPEYIEKFYACFKNLPCEPSHLALYRGPMGDLRDYVLDKDVFYVGGGNTRNLLALWREWGLDAFMREAYENGAVMGGVSAGALCWFEAGVTDSVPGALTGLTCLRYLYGSYCPHYDGEKERRPSYHQLIAAGMKAGIACDDSVAARYENEVFVECVSSQPTPRAYRVALQDGKVVETPVEPRRL